MKLTNKKPPFFLAIIFVLIALFSCKAVVYRVAFGVKKPSEKRTFHVLKFLDKHDYNKENLYGLNSDSYYSKIKNANSAGVFASDRLYDSNGILVYPSDSSVRDCYGTIGDFYKGLTNSNSYFVDSSVSIYHDTVLTRGLVNLKGSPQRMFETKDYDFTLVIYWSTFMGRISRNVLDFESNIKTFNPSLKVQVVKINMDYRDYMEGDDIEAIIQ